MKSVEFYKKGHKIFVEYNDKTYTFAEFLYHEDSQYIIKKMYHKIIMDYSKKVEKEVENLNNKGEVVGVFIKKFFLKKDKTYDVTIMGDGSVVNFHLEK